jgi:isopentenyl diphosphate isomerase/L-lactate dehydrogenase-like FMN-dependent dehydrogenase
MKKMSFGSVEEARRIARRRLPAAVYHYVEGGKDAEITAFANELAFSRVFFSPRICSTRNRPDLSTTVLGRRISMPLVIAPTGFVRVVHSDGEMGAARAAKAAGIPIAISTLCGEPAARIAGANDDTWFQLYMIGGRRGAQHCIDLARVAGCRVLVVTVDVAGLAQQDRMARPLPSRVSLKEAFAFLPQAWNRPRWLLSLLRGGLEMRAPNAPPKEDGSEMALMEAGPLLVATPPSWDDLAWIRQQWDGPMVVKGILRVDDARRAADLGVDGISISNHGAKVLDGSPSTLSMLPSIADAVGDRIDILLDGGVRRGADVVRACALGAKAVLIGRPYLWGLAAGGEAGVAGILRLMRHGMSATMSQLGCASVAELGLDALHPLPDFWRWNDVGVDLQSRLK